MTNDFRSLLAELYTIFEKYDDESNLAGIRDDLKSDGNDILDRARAALAMPKSQVPKNCWLDDEPDLCPSACVFDDPDDRIDDCVCAQILKAEGRVKTECKYYRQ